MPHILIKVNYYINKSFSYYLKFRLKNGIFLETSNGWHKIAWAFLKLIGKNNALNINDKLRLQFYKSHRPKSKNHLNVCEPYVWWKNRKLEKYSSTLYVTIKGINSQLLLDTFSLRCRRKSRSNINQDVSIKTEDEDVPLNDSKIHWDKLLHKKCQLPNSMLSKLETYDEGCFIAKFSNSGRYLAYSILLNSNYTIIVYSVSSI